MVRTKRFLIYYSNFNYFYNIANTGKSSFINGVNEERARNYSNEKVADPEKKMVRYYSPQIYMCVNRSNK